MRTAEDVRRERASLLARVYLGAFEEDERLDIEASDTRAKASIIRAILEGGEITRERLVALEKALVLKAVELAADARILRGGKR